MCDKIKEDLESKKEDIMEAVKIVKEFVPEIKSINILIKKNEEAIKEEIIERKCEDKEIKENYIKRFDEIKNMIKDTNKLLIGLFITILTMFIGSTVFLVLNNIYQWLK